MPDLSRRLALALALALGAAASATVPWHALAQDATVARPGAGALRGRAVEGGLAFMGIPYAAPPVGAHRFRSPRPMPPWQGVRDAVRPGAAAIQTIPPWAAWLYAQPARTDEDCLFLNVWTPGLAGRRPVMVWLHGGAWRTGEGAAAGNDGATLARRGDVVVVTVNYRLNALGFLAHPDLRDPESGAAANWGIQDQALALRWVRDNIAAFGGDPSSVTLFGQSAGGASVANLVQNPDHAGLVHRAVIQSGALWGPPALPDLEGAAPYAEALATKLGTTVGALRDLPARQLHETELGLAREWAVQRGGRVPILPIVDDRVVRAAPRDADLPAMPLLIGTVRDEGVFWFDLVGPDGKAIPGQPVPRDETGLATMVEAMRASYRPRGMPAEDAIATYRRLAGERRAPTDPRSLWIALYSDLAFRADAVEVARAHARAGNATFLYEFAHPLAPPARGVPHCAEIPFVFGTNVDPYFAAKSGTGPAENRLAEAMMQAWSGFARTGAPASQEGGAWEPVSAEGLGINVLGEGETIRRTASATRAEELSCWLRT